MSSKDAAVQRLKEILVQDRKAAQESGETTKQTA